MKAINLKQIRHSPLDCGVSVKRFEMGNLVEQLYLFWSEANETKQIFVQVKKPVKLLFPGSSLEGKVTISGAKMRSCQL